MARNSTSSLLWPRAGLVLALAFVATSVWLMVSVQRSRQDFIALVVLVGLACLLAASSAWQARRGRKQYERLRAAQAALEESQSRLSTVISSTPIVLWAIDSEGIFTLSTGEGLRPHGLEDGGLVGHSIYEVRRDVPAILDGVRKAIHGETVWDRIEVDGHFYHACFLPLRDTDGTITGVTGVATDFTERHRAEGALRHSEEARLASQKVEAVGRLAGGIAHEFSNLLTVIGGFGSLAYRRLGPGHECVDDLERVLRASNQASKLTHDLLAFSRHQSVEPEVVDLNQKLEESAQMLRALLEEKIRLETHLHPEPLPVLIDTGRLEQVVVNLALNARDALPDGGALAFESSRYSPSVMDGADELHVGEFARLRVVDDGVGMTKEVRDRIFEPFFTTKERGEGTGLGLATCHGVICQAGGSIRVESEPARGTCIEILLPLQTTGAMLGRRIVPAVNGLPRGEGTVLLAEDNTMVRSFAARVLRDIGYEVLEAENGSQAIEVARGFPGVIDLLVTDIVMPEMGGRELARELLDRFPDLRVLCISGYSGSEPLTSADAEREVHFLAKPFSPRELGQVVRDMMEAPEPVGSIAAHGELDLDPAHTVSP